MNVDETERAELIAALLHQPATFAEALFHLNTRLLDVLTTGENAAGADAVTPAERGLLEARAIGSAWKQLGVVTQRLLGKRDASLGPSVRLVRPGLTAGGYGGHHVGTHER